MRLKLLFGKFNVSDEIRTALLIHQTAAKRLEADCWDTLQAQLLWYLLATAAQPDLERSKCKPLVLKYSA